MHEPDAEKKEGSRREWGMQAVFRMMAEERDGYGFIHPVRLWKDWGTSNDGKVEQEVVAALENTMQYI